MKKILLAIAGLMFSLGVYAQDVSVGTDYGFLMRVPVAGSYVFTNDNVYPFLLHSLVFNSSVANTTTVNRVHYYKADQVVGWTVTTNAYLGIVETNYSAQVTNVLTTAITNQLLSATNSGSDVYTTDDIKQVYIQTGDLLQFNFSDTSTNILLINTIR